MLELNKIYLDDCVSGLKQLEDESIDAMVTDPPYGYSFMGKDWDKSTPSIEIWKECLRVLKPGGWAMVMSAPRQDVLSEMIVKLTKAGFNTGFTSIYHAYASGFPKAGNASKMADKKLGLKRKGMQKTGAGSKGNTFPLDKQYETGDPLSAAAADLDGSYLGFQPKPAIEIIVVSMMNRQFIGFEKETDYHRIAEERIAHYLKQCKLSVSELMNEELAW